MKTINERNSLVGGMLDVGQEGNTEVPTDELPRHSFGRTGRDNV
jgi:hypothetical protein